MVIALGMEGVGSAVFVSFNDLFKPLPQAEV
jgi:hypothetical protein